MDPLSGGTSPTLVAQDKEILRALVRAAKEGGRVLREIGYRRRQPFRFHLFYWLPESMSMVALRKLLASRFAEIAFAMHAKSARDEMRSLAGEFQELVERTKVQTPNWDQLRAFLM